MFLNSHRANGDTVYSIMDRENSKIEALGTTYAKEQLMATTLVTEVCIRKEMFFSGSILVKWARPDRWL